MKKLKRWGIPIEKQDLINMQLEGLSQQKMALRLGVHVATVEKRIKLFNLQGFTTVRYDLMTLKNPQFCYLLGWFCSDGYLTKGNRVSIRTYEKEPMKALSEYFGTKLYEITLSTGKITYEVYFALAPAIFKSLFSGNKTRTIQVPDIPTENLPYFFRGVIEGDGCIRPAGKSKSTLMRLFTASKDFAEQFQKLVQSQGFKCRLRVDRMGWELSTDSLDFCTYIYQGLEEFITPRKHGRVQEWLSI